MVCQEQLPQGWLSVVTENLGIRVYRVLHSKIRNPSEDKGRKNFDKIQIMLEKIRKQNL